MLAESDDIIVPTHYNARLEYAIAKTLTEAATINSRHRGLRALVIRPFNIAGPRQSRAGGFVMPTFVQQAIAGRPLTVFAGGGQERAFLSATDLARFITDHVEDALETHRPIFNLGNPENSTTVWKLAERIVSRLGSTSPIEHADARLIHGPLYEEAESIQKLPVLDAAAAVGWAPTITLDELIDETALYYRVRDDAREANAVPLDAGVRV
jgi:nucleoside-diphosphate-sugar epimerase